MADYDALLASPPAELGAIAALEWRQDQVLAELEALNLRIEAILAPYSLPHSEMESRQAVPADTPPSQLKAA